MQFETFGEGKKVRYIACGDSGALGTGASSPNGAYAARIARALSTQYTVSYVNIAANGIKIKGFISGQLPLVIAAHPDIVVLSLGINDTFYMRSQNYILKNMRAVLRAFEEQSKAHIFVASLPDITGAVFFPRWYVRWFNRRAYLINAELKKLETKQVRIVDIYTIDWSSAGGRGKIFAADGLHLNDRGHEKLASIFLEHIQNCAILKRSDA